MLGIEKNVCPRCSRKTLEENFKNAENYPNSPTGCIFMPLILHIRLQTYQNMV